MLSESEKAKALKAKEKALKEKEKDHSKYKILNSLNPEKLKKEIKNK